MGCFNSTMVRLKGSEQRYERELQRSFNSTMVRLKEKVECCTIHLKEFQFHNGSIKGRSTTKKNKIIFNDLLFSKLTNFIKKSVDPTK